jgi:hypothetical protein
MGLVINRKQVLHGELRIALGGGETFMTKHFLDGPQIRAFFEQMGTEGVA